MAEEFTVTPGEDLNEVLRRASGYLRLHGVPQAAVDAQLLAAHVLTAETGEEITRGRLQALALIGRQISESFAEDFAEHIATRARRVPLQHITGRAYFRGLELAVGPGVFIPRPETEILVGRVLQDVDARPAEAKVVDLCTGSGAIAAAIAQERPKVQVTAVELSDLAHAWAERNLAGSGVRLIHDDAGQALPGEENTFDVVASNPPYIPTVAVPQDPEVAEHDPAMALYGGSEDGLAIPARIVTRAWQLLKPGGFVIVEHAETQREGMRTVLERAGFVALESIDDLTGRPRHTAGYKPSG